jgi:hypothetical protein
MAARFDPNGTQQRPDYPRSPLEALMVGVMRLSVRDRGLSLIPQASRCLRTHDIHEFILTEEAAGPGSRVGDVAYLGFASFVQGGVAMAGDEVRVGANVIGWIVGFDETHMPNHMNIVLRVARLQTGIELGVALGDRLTIEPVFR